jgi:hypothetical protein
MPEAPANTSRLISEYMPAADTSAAVNWQDYGTSRWQLMDYVILFCRAKRKGLGRYRVDTAQTRHSSWRRGS